MESFNPQNESLKDKLKKYALYLALIASPAIADGQTIEKNDSLDQQKNIELVHDIFSRPEAIAKHQKSLEDSFAYTGLSYRVDHDNSENQSIDSITKHIHTVGEKFINYIDIKDYNDTLAKDSLEKGTEVFGGYSIIKEHGMSEDIGIMIRDTNRDGKADIFKIDDNIYEEGYLTQKHSLLGKHPHFDLTKKHGVLNTNGMNKDDMFRPTTREEVIHNLGQEEGEKFLRQVDEKYHEILEIAHEKFTSEKPKTDLEL